ncbi:hypothetical protein TWF730_011203 [Orbilia blumenaviensis]|uniref:K Homology domain-containing protein n=1 Tax=Orbilia blumenaviensis TaxID=1796055 RepID=A0AAV9UN35_9PEZI
MRQQMRYLLLFLSTYLSISSLPIFASSSVTGNYKKKLKYDAISNNWRSVGDRGDQDNLIKTVKRAGGDLSPEKKIDGEADIILALTKGKELVMRERDIMFGTFHPASVIPLADFRRKYFIDLVNKAKIKCPSTVENLFSESRSPAILSQEPSYYDLVLGPRGQTLKYLRGSCQSSIVDRHLILTWKGTSAELEHTPASESILAKVLFSAWGFAVHLSTAPVPVSSLSGFPLSFITFLVPDKKADTIKLLSLILKREGETLSGRYKKTRPYDLSSRDYKDDIAWHFLLGIEEISAVQELLNSWPYEFPNSHIQTIEFKIFEGQPDLNEIGAIITVQLGSLATAKPVTEKWPPRHEPPSPQEGPSKRPRIQNTYNTDVNIRNTVQLDFQYERQVDAELDLFKAFQAETVLMDGFDFPIPVIQHGRLGASKPVYNEAVFSWTFSTGDLDFESGTIAVSTSAENGCIIIWSILNEDVLTQEVLGELILKAWSFQQGARFLQNIIFNTLSLDTFAHIEKAYDVTDTIPGEKLIFWGDEVYWKGLDLGDKEAEQGNEKLKVLHDTLLKDFGKLLEFGAVSKMVSHQAQTIAATFPKIRTLEIIPNRKPMPRNAGEGGSGLHSVVDGFLMLIRIVSVGISSSANLPHMLWALGPTAKIPKLNTGLDMDFLSSDHANTISIAITKGYNAKRDLEHVLENNIQRHGEAEDPPHGPQEGEGIETKLGRWYSALSFGSFKAHSIQQANELVELYNSGVDSNGQPGFRISKPSKNKNSQPYVRSQMKLSGEKDTCAAYYSKRERRLVIRKFSDFGPYSTPEGSLGHLAQAMYLTLVAGNVARSSGHLKPDNFESGLSSSPLDSIQSIVILELSPVATEIIQTSTTIAGLIFDKPLFLSVTGDFPAADPQYRRLLYAILGSPELLLAQAISTNFRGEPFVANQVVRGIYLRPYQLPEFSKSLQPQQNIEMLIVFGEVPGPRKQPSPASDKGPASIADAYSLGKTILGRLNIIVPQFLSMRMKPDRLLSMGAEYRPSGFFGSVQPRNAAVQVRHTEYLEDNTWATDIGVHLLTSQNLERYVSRIYRDNDLQAQREVQVLEVTTEVEIKSEGRTGILGHICAIDISLQGGWLALQHSTATYVDTASDLKETTENIAAIYDAALPPSHLPKSSIHMLWILGLNIAAIKKIDIALALDGRLCSPDARIDFVKPSFDSGFDHDQYDFSTGQDDAWATLLSIAEIAAFVKVGWYMLEQRRDSWFSPTVITVFCPVNVDNAAKFRIGVWVDHYSSVNGQVCSLKVTEQLMIPECTDVV